MLVNRSERLYSLRYCLMFLVIVGHVFSQEQFSQIEGCVVIWKWIYMFHMPLFVFISGYFSRKKDRREFIVSSWKIIEPFVLFQSIMCLYRFFVHGSISISYVLTPWWVLWYLFSLFCWRLILQILPNKILSSAKLVIILTIIFSLLVGFLPLNRILSLQRTFAFMPFFFLGYYMKEKNLFIGVRYRLLSIIFLLITFLLPMFCPQLLGDLNQADPYVTPMDVLCRIFVFVLSIPISIAFINICPNRPWIAKQGRLSMQYYIYHSFMIFVLMKIVSRYSLSTTFMVAVVCTLLITILIGLFLNISFFEKLTNPSSFYSKKQYN